MNEVKKFLNEYIENILNGKEITIKSTTLINSRDLTGNVKVNALKNSIENHPENLICYLTSSAVDLATKDILKAYYTDEERKKLTLKLCQNPELWLKLNEFLKSLLNEDDLLNVSKSILNNFSEDNSEQNKIAIQFLKYCAESKYVTTLPYNDTFNALASRMSRHLRPSNYYISTIPEYFGVIRKCATTEELRVIEEKALKSDITNLELAKLSFNFKRLSPNFFNTFTNNFFEIIKKFERIEFDNTLKSSGSPKVLIEKIVRNLTDKDIYNICFYAINHDIELVLSKTYSGLFNSQQRKKIYDILYDENVFLLIATLVRTKGISRSYFQYLTLKDLDLIYKLLINEYDIKTIRCLTFWSNLDENQLTYLYKKFEERFRREALGNFTSDWIKKYLKGTNVYLSKMTINSIIDDLIILCKKHNDISFFIGYGISLFEKEQIAKITTELKPLFMENIHLFHSLWQTIKENFTDEEFSLIVGKLLKENCYLEAYDLIKSEKRCEHKLFDVHDALLEAAKGNYSNIPLISPKMLKNFNAEEIFQFFNIILDVNKNLVREYSILMDSKQKKNIKEAFLVHYKECTLERQLYFINYLGNSLKDNIEVIDYVIDRIYEEDIKKLATLKTFTNFVWTSAVRRAIFHQEKLIKYMLNATKDDLESISDIIKSNKIFSDIKLLKENGLFRLKGYELKGLPDCFKLCALYKKSNTSVELFCKKYSITPVAGFDEALRIIGTIDTQELAEISEIKAAAAKRFYYNMTTLAYKLINDKLSFEEYFTVDTYKFKNQKLVNLVSVYKTRENVNKFALRFIDYIVDIIDKKGYLPKSVLEFLSFGNDKLTDILQKNIKSNLILPRDKDYYIKYNRMQKFLVANTKSYFRNGLLMEFQINGIHYVVDDDVIDKSYIYLRKNNYCVSQDSMLTATRQVAMGLIDVSKETNAYKETLVSSIADTITECHTLEEYIKMQEQKGPKLNKTILSAEDNN